MLRTALAGLALALSTSASAAITFGGVVEVPGDATDLSGLGETVNDNRLSIGSDLTYHARTGTFWGVTDRGAGGGSIDFAPRVHAFTVDIDGNTAAVSNFSLNQTIVFRQADGSVYSGLTPDRLPGGSTQLANALDPEGIVRLPNGQFLVSDEYGPSVYLFSRTGKFLRAFTQPENVIPKIDGTPDYAAARPILNSGRQDNRGYEGLTVSGDGKTAWAILQDPLVTEGAQNDGRRSRNLRIVEFDVESGESTAQYIYRLENRDDINARIPGTDFDFSATQQGRNIGVSSITWIGGTTFLVIERDNRGQGPDNLIAGGGTLAPIGTKRVYLIDIAGATDVSGLSLVGTNSLPDGVTPVSKTLFLDIQAQLEAAGVTVAEKIEGLAIGPRFADGSFALVLATDNDFSVTQNADGIQFDVCTDGTAVTIGDPCPEGEALIPSRVYTFKVSGDTVNLFDRSLFAVPEPATWAMMIAGFGLVGGAMRRRRALAA
jgi:hypothetical protein